MSMITQPEPQNPKEDSWIALLPAGLQKDLEEQPEIRELSLEALVKRAQASQNAQNEPLADKLDVSCAADYGLSCPEHAKDWYDESLLEQLGKSLFDAKLSKAQAQALHQSFVSAMHQRWLDAQNEAQYQQQQELLEKEQRLDSQLDQHWGKGRARKEQLVNSALRTLGFEPSALEALLQIGKPMQTLDVLVRIGEANSEEPLFGEADQPLDAKSQLKSLSADQSHRNAFLDPTHPAHERAKALRARLIKQALSQ